LRDDRSAIADFDHSIRLSHDYGRAYAGRAMAYERLGDHARAAADRAEARRLGAR
jgi:Tfp pilus assembly protein PilF